MRPGRILLLALGACCLLGLYAWFLAQGERADRAAEGTAARVDGRSERIVVPAAEAQPAPESEAAGAGGREAGSSPPASPDSKRRRERAPAEAPVVGGLHGRLLGPGGAPVSGATVLAAARNDGRPWPLDAADHPMSRMPKPHSVGSGPDGRFRIIGLPPGPIRVAVRKQGLCGLDLDELWLPAVDGLALGDVWIERGVALEGRVFGAGAGALEGALLVALDPFLPVPATELNQRSGSPIALTGSDGSFRTYRLKAGPWRILVSHPEHPQQVFEGFLSDSGSKTRKLDFELPRGTELEGLVKGIGSDHPLVVRAAPLRSVLRANDERVTFADELEYCAGYRECPVDESGAFVLKGLPADERYLLRVLHPAQLLGAEDAFATQEVVWSGAGKVSLRHGMGGTLVCGVRDRSSGQPIADFELQWIGAWPERHLDPSGKRIARYAGGQVRWTGIRPHESRQTRSQPEVSGPLELVVESEGYETLRRGGLSFARGGILDLGWLELDPLPKLEVHVVDDRTDRPVAGAEVRLAAQLPDPLHRSESSALTDAAGRARVGAVRSPALVQATHDERASAIEAVHPFVSDVDPPLVLRLGACAQVSTSVLGRAGAPTLAVEVLRRGFDPWNLDQHGLAALELVVVDSQGQALFDHLGPGQYAFAARSVARLGFPPSSRSPRLEWIDVRLAAGDEHSLTLSTSALETAQGELRFGRDALAGAALKLELEGEDFLPFDRRWRRPIRSFTDERGRFAFWNLAPGEYDLTILHAASGVVTRRSLGVWPRQRPLRIDVADTDMRGWVLDSDGVPAQDVLVSVRPSHLAWADEEQIVPGSLWSDLAPEQPALLSTSTNAAGAFAFPAFPPETSCDVVFRLADQSCASVEHLAAGEVVKLTTRLQLDGHVFVDIATRVKDPLGVIAVHTTRPRRIRAEIVGRGDDLRWNLAPGKWKVRLCSLYESEIVTELGPWHEVEIESGTSQSLELEWPVRKRTARGR